MIRLFKHKFRASSIFLFFISKVRHVTSCFAYIYVASQFSRGKNRSKSEAMARLQTMSIIFCSFLFFTAPIFGMHVESYWESWVLKDYPNDWCALLKEVPASPIGSTEGANYVSIGKKHIMIRFVNRVWRKLGLKFLPLLLLFYSLW